MEQMKLDLDILCGKTSPEPSAQTTVRTSAQSSKKSAESSTKAPMFLDLTRGGGTLWRTSGAIVGDGYSVAWRVLDAQFWGVPQRRRRIALVADFGGQTAPEILFNRTSLSGSAETRRTSREGTPADPAGGARTTGGGKELNEHTVGSLCASDAKWVSNQTIAQGKLIVEPREVYDARGNGNGKTVPTITGDHNDRITDYTAVVCSAPTYCLQGNGINRSDTAGCNGKGVKEGVCYTLNTIDRPAVADESEGYVVRRITPLECERLQGFPDGWTDIGDWVDEKGKTRQTTDAARYKALGNSIAIPPWKWVLKRLCANYERDATMASLFDGIGGFPLIWEQLNGRGSCLWASEIEEFPIAVTKRHFQGVTT